MCMLLTQWTQALNEVQLLMEKMMMVQQQEEEFTQEEMVTRFERERTESLLELAEGGVLYILHVFIEIYLEFKCISI